MATYGVTSAGFIMPQLSDIQTEINASIISIFGADVDLNPESNFGQLSGIFSERESLVWQAMQDVYNSQNPDEAFGASLDNIGSLRGIPRLGAQASVVQNVRIFGTAGTLLPASSTQFSVINSPSSLFALNIDTTLVAGASCVQTISFSTVPVSGTWVLALGGTETAPLAHNISAANLQVAIRDLQFASGCVVTGNFSIGFTITFAGAGTGGFMVQPLFVAPSASNSLQNSVPAQVNITPLITVPGVDQASVTVTAVDTGPVLANAGTLVVIATPITGLTGVLNTSDAVVGRDVEEDNTYRARMDQELQVAGAGTVEAIRSRLLQITGVTTALVFENITDIVDGVGRPPHSFEAVVLGGSDADIANTIWLAKPAGIPTYGTSNYTITDSQGQTHIIYFSRPYAVPVYIIANLTVDDSYPVNGDVTVQENLANYGNTLGIGAELIVIPKLISQIAAIQGIQDAVLLVGTSPGPTLPDNINPTAYQVLTFDTSRIQVNHV